MERPTEHTVTVKSDFPYVTAGNKPISRNSRLFAFGVLVALGLTALFTDPLPEWVALLAGVMAGFELHHWTVFENLYGDGGEE